MKTSHRRRSADWADAYHPPPPLRRSRLGCLQEARRTAPRSKTETPQGEGSMQVSRRRALATTGAGIAAATILRRARAADAIKTAAIYTVPIEQQWVSRIHLAANTAKDRGDIEYVFSESVANTDYERVMREYAEAGHTLIIGEAFAVEEAARSVARDYPKTAFLIGSSFKPDASTPNFSVFDNYIQDASYLTG